MIAAAMVALAMTGAPKHDALLEQIRVSSGELVLLASTCTGSQSTAQAVRLAVTLVTDAYAGPTSDACPDGAAKAGEVLLLSQTWTGGTTEQALQTALRAVMEAAAGPERPM